jgi:hypothetical protein
MTAYSQGFFLLRKFICSGVIIVTVYCFPFLKTVRAITHSSKEEIKDLLTYWSVLSIISTIQYFIFFFHPRMDQYPPEFNLVFMLLLTLKQFNGIDLINQRIIQPFYLKHEHKIDEIVQEAADWAKDFAVRHSRNLIYQLLLSKDGLAMAIVSAVWKFSSFMDGFDAKTMTNSFKPLRIGQKILQDFTLIMREEGIVMRAGIDLEHLRFINCSIHEKNSNYFALRALDDDSTYLLPILLIRSMDMFEDSEDGRESIQISFYKDIFIHGNVNDVHYSATRGMCTQSICLDLPEDDCEAFVGGIQVYLTSVKTRSLRRLDRMVNALQRIHKKTKFRHWKALTEVTGDSLRDLSTPLQLHDWNIKK